MAPHLEYKRFPKGDSCTEEGCKSKKWYIDANGRKYCRNGHEQVGFTQTAQDEDDWNITGHGRTTRKKREVKEKVQVVYSGKDATSLYLECYQLILWKQCHWLVETKGFPPELETIVRDLWGLRAKISFGEKEEEEGFASRTETQGFSSTEDGETTDGATSYSSRWSRKTDSKGRDRLPKLPETLALCYLGILLLRLPTSLGEIYKWAARDEIVYTRAIKEIPLEMRRRLPAHFHAALEIHTPLKGSQIYSAVLELIEFYNIQINMVFPPLNAPLLIEKHVRDLGLPIEIFQAVRRLADILKFDFTYPILYKRNYGVLAYPEVQLMCLIVVATKLSQPFDDIVRHPESDFDPSTVRIDWSRWSEIMKEKKVPGLKRGEEIMVTDMDVLVMNKEAIDDYMNWYQRIFLDDKPPKMPERILDFFPLPDLPPQEPIDSEFEVALNRLELVQKDRVFNQPVRIDEDESVKRLGEFYKRYRTIEELPKFGKKFYEKASLNIGISLKGLVRGVFQTEVALDNWRLEERKKLLIDIEEQGLKTSN